MPCPKLPAASVESFEGALNSLLVQLEDQHRRFLEEIAVDVQKALSLAHTRFDISKGESQAARSQHGAPHADQEDLDAATRSTDHIGRDSAIADKMSPLGSFPQSQTALSSLKSSDGEHSGVTVSMQADWLRIVNDGVDLQALALEKTQLSKTRRRLRALMNLPADQQYVSTENLRGFLNAKEHWSVLADQVDEMVVEMRTIAEAIPNTEATTSLRDEVASKPSGNLREPSLTEDVPENAISVDTLAQIVALPTLTNFATESRRKILKHMIEAFSTTTTVEVIDSVTRGAEEDSSWKTRIRPPTWERHLNIVVGICVVVSVATMGPRVDVDPNHVLWFLVELLCTTGFTAEIAIKIIMWGPRNFFTGDAWRWNVLDIVVTFFSLIDLCINLLELLLTEVSGDTPTAKVLRTAVILRTLRSVRVIRLVKLLNSPMARDLAKMIVGLVIGIPSLAWVVLLYLIVIYVVGFIFRILLGPAAGQDQTDMCGTADYFNPDDHPGMDCRVHYMYGEEFCGTLTLSMFTAFRFMLGDFSTRRGHSLVVVFSEGYGWKFNAVFITWMIIVNFGFYNIISALFVDATISGLKHNDAKRKLVRQYERAFVRAKLNELISRIEMLDSGRKSRMVRRSDSFDLCEEDFIRVMEDEQVKALLRDLDVVSHNPAGLFDTFDLNCHGRVTGPEFVEAVVKLRGEPQKNDVIASWLALRRLVTKIDRLHSLMIKSSRAKSAHVRNCSSCDEASTDQQNQEELVD